MIVLKKCFTVLDSITLASIVNVCKWWNDSYWKVVFNYCWRAIVTNRLLSLTISNIGNILYSDNQKTVEYEDEIEAILKWTWFCYKANT